MNSNVIGPSARNLDRFQVEVGFADRREPLLFADLLQAVEQAAPLFTWSETSSRKRCSTTLRGARPIRKPGTAAVGISSPNALSK